MKLGRYLVMFLIVFLIVTGNCYATTNRIVGEINIKGPTRSDEDIIKRQLPYDVGDRWKKRMKN